MHLLFDLDGTLTDSSPGTTVRAVAAGWGYGTRDELVAAGPEYFAPTVAHVVDWVHTAG